MTSPLLRRSNTLFRNTAYIASASVLWQVLAIVTLPLLIKSVGPNDFGIFSLAAASLGYFGILSLPARQAVLKFVAQAGTQSPNNLSDVVSSAAALNIFVGVITAAILGMMAWNVSTLFTVTEGGAARMQLILTMYAVASLIIQPLSIYSSILQGHQEFRLIALMDAFTAIYRVTAILAIMHFDGSIFWYAGADILAEVLKGLVLRRRVKRQFRQLRFRFSLVADHGIGRIMRYGSWALLYALSLMIVIQGSKVLIGMVLAVSLVTFFHIGSMFYNVVNTFGSLLRAAVLPSSSAALASGDHVFVEKLITSGSLISLAIMLPFCVHLYLFSDVIIAVWMGQDFVSGATPISRLLVASWIFIIPVFLLSSIYWGQDRIAPLSISAAVGAVIFVPTFFMLADSFGLQGIGWAIVAYFATQLPIQLYIISKVLKISVLRFVFKVCLPAYLVSGSYGLIVFCMKDLIIEIDNLSSLLAVFCVSLVVSILVNLTFTARNEVMLIVSKIASPWFYGRR